MSRTAIIGASGPVGASCARDLRRRGYSLILNGRRRAELTALMAETESRGVLGDCRNDAIAQEMLDGVDSVDLVVHAAGVLHGEPVAQQSVEVFEDVVATNLFGPYASIKAALPMMGPGSRIILISSMTANEPARGRPAYAAAMAGVNALATVLSREVERDGISVSVVFQGAVEPAALDQRGAPSPVLSCEDVASLVGWLSGLEPRILIPYIAFRAARRGPFAQDDDHRPARSGNR